jgi:hypothetical protein
MKLKRSGRLFTFGCSFTKYFWPTWADIIGQDFDYFENWAEPGSGNVRIAHRITECVYSKNLTKDDTVCIMWSGISREDTYKKNKWNSTTIHDRGFLKNNIDDRADTILNLGTVAMVHNLLENIRCNWWASSMIGLCALDTTLITGEPIHTINLNNLDNSTMSMVDRIFNLEKNLIAGNTNLDPWAAAPDALRMYLPVYQQLVPSASSFLWERISKDIKNRPNKDTHPTPEEHLLLVDTYFNNQISDNARQFALQWEERVRKNCTEIKWNSIDPSYL